MPLRLFRAIVFLVSVTSLGALACDLSTLGLGLAAKPQVTILSPAAGAQVNEGEEIQIQSISTDPAGVVRVDLAVDGATVATDVPPIPKGQTAYTLVQRWRATPGTHTVSVRAYNASGAASEPALISIAVAPAIAQTTPIPTQVVQPPLGAPSPTLPQPVVTQPSAPVATATRAPTRPTASPTISAPPGVWAMAIRVDPANPKKTDYPTFYVTFLNSTGSIQRLRWFVKLYEPDKPNAKGETAKIDNDIPVGTSELPSPNNWRDAVIDCQTRIARVYYIDPASTQVTEFLKPDRSGGPASQFQVCP